MKLAAGLLLILTLVFPVRALNFVVTKTADTNDGVCDSDCSLREAIRAANANPGPDTITLPAGTYTLTIPGANEGAAATGDLDVSDDLTINGAGAATTIVDGGALDRVFEIGSLVTVAFNNITIRGGQAPGGQNGGGILNSSGTVTITNCVITQNSAGPSGGNGGGIYQNSAAGMTIIASTIVGNTTGGGGNGAGIDHNSGPLTITDSTISGNIASPNGNGAGIYVNGFSMTMTGSTVSGNSTTSGTGGGIFINSGPVTLTNSTISGNGAAGASGLLHNGSGLTVTDTTIAGNTGGPGVQNTSSTLSLRNTIVANNSVNCSGTITDNGTNIQFPGTTCGATIPSADPLLQPLANNGGPTQTRALGAGSPAINAGTTGCPPTPATDQRGVSRPQGAACDIGAFECAPTECGAVQPTATPTNTPVVQPTATPTNTPVGVATSTPTRTPTQGGAPVVVPTLSTPMLALLALALAAAALLFLKRVA